MRTIVKIFIIASLLIVCATSAMAETLNVMTIGLSPYGYVEKGKPTGLVYIIGNMLAEEAGYEANNIIAPLSRAVNDLGSGKADVTIMLSTPEVEKVATSIGTVMSVESVVLGRAGTPMRNFREIKGKTLAGVRGAKYDERICKCNGIIAYPVENYEQGLKMVVAKRVDGIVGPKLGLFHTAKQLGLPKQSFGKPLILSSSDAKLFLSNMAANIEKAQRLEDALKRLLQNGTIKSLIEKYSL